MDLEHAYFLGLFQINLCHDTLTKISYYSIFLGAMRLEFISLK